MNCGATVTIAVATWHEAVRRRLALLGAAIGALFLVLYGAAFHLAAAPDAGRVHLHPALQRQGYNVFLMLGLYAAATLTGLVAILVSCDAISGEIANGAMQTLLSKPVARRQVLLGKWLGLAALLTVFQTLLLGGVLAIAAATAGYAAPHTVAAMPLLWLEMLVLLTITLLWGTRLSTLANGMASLGLFGLAFLGGWIEQIGTLTRHPRAVDIGIVASLLMPSDALWRRAAFDMQSPLESLIGMSPFTTPSVPSRFMVAYAGIYAALALLLALRSFQTRDL